MLKVMKNRQSITSAEEGLVAIFTVLVVMGILTLLTLGFSNITRQAQKRTLDDQLSTQAFYAAETGINRAWNLIDTGVLTSDKTECLNEMGSIDFGYAIDSPLGISVSCLLIDLSPSSVQFSSVPVGEARAFYIGRSTGPEINQFTFNWDNTGEQSPSNDDLSPDAVFDNGSPRLLTDANWGTRVGMVRVDIIPITADMTETLARDRMAEDSYSVFLYPSADPNADGSDAVHHIHTGINGQGIVLGRQCTGSNPGYRCTATVRMADGTSTGYYMRVRSYYNAVSLEITAKDTNGDSVEFHNTQAVIDSTGKVNDVYRRLKVSVPIGPEFPGYHEPFSILSASSLCKRIIGVPDASVIDTADGAGSDPACTISDP